MWENEPLRKHWQGNHLSNIFLTCILRFFSSALLDEADATADVSGAGVAVSLLFRARLVGGC